MKTKDSKLLNKSKIPKKQLRMHKISWTYFHPLKALRGRWMLGVSLFHNIFRVAAAWQVLGVLIFFMVVGYVLSAFYTGAGEFVISIDRPMANDGIVISDTQDFSLGLISLKDKAVKDADNISIYDIDRDVGQIDGPHNGQNYVAYTFYITNHSNETKDYDYEVNIRSSTKEADSATWFMVFEDDVPIIYAKKEPDGNPACQFSSYEFPFVNNDDSDIVTKISDSEPGLITQNVIDYHNFQTLDGVHQLKTIPFESDSIIVHKTINNFGVNDIHKYTVVIWLEGEDPDCVDSILGGSVEARMNFSYTEEEKK